MKEMWNKPANELSAKENTIMSLEVLAITAGVIAAGVVVINGVDRIVQWRKNRKESKPTLVVDEEK